MCSSSGTTGNLNRGGGHSPSGKSQLTTFLFSLHGNDTNIGNDVNVGDDTNKGVNVNMEFARM